MADVFTIIRRLLTDEAAFTISILILVFGLILSFAVWRWSLAFLRNAGVEDAVEGTPFERTAQGFGTSTVGMLSALAAMSVYLGAVVVSLNVARLVNPTQFWSHFTGYLPRIFLAAFALIIGLIAGDKGRVVVSERLRSIKVPEADVIPELVRYSIIYVAFLLALSQLGIATAALLILLAAYAFGVFFLAGLAFKDLLAASAAGVYLLLVEPYTIGDEIRIGDHQGIVQEIDMFVTHIESDGQEYILPNQKVFRTGVVRVRE